MLFNSYEFILLFLPTVVLGFYAIGQRLGAQVAFIWLIVASLFFYGWWYPAYLVLISASILANFSVGWLVDRAGSSRWKYTLTTIGILFNLGLLGYYKYADFVADNLELVLPWQWDTEGIFLPLAISFFTFQQIAYLVDVYKGETNEPSLMRYSLFVVFFPQLIAGPIVHHKELLPQFVLRGKLAVNHEDIAIGLTFFIIGLFKKVVIADNVAVFASPTFDAVANGTSVDLFTAWSAAFAYTFQLYFDFSGYSDMAIGLARILGVRLPDNFNSPYKSASIIEFWRRWHITLSTFLRQYVYIPLGGNRKGERRKYFNLYMTMFAGGIWHGAGWTFVLWGSLHGVYLLINHYWRARTTHIQWQWGTPRLRKSVAVALTFLLVLIGWVLFRAADLATALDLYLSMLGGHGAAWNSEMITPYAVYSGLFIIVLALPNTKEFILNTRPEDSLDSVNALPLRTQARWKTSPIQAVVLATLFVATILNIGSASEFLYFQF